MARLRGTSVVAFSGVTALVVLASACGSEGGGTGGGGGSTVAPGPLAISPATARSTAAAYFVADNAAQQALDTSRLTDLEEGPLAAADNAEYLTYRGHRKSFAKFTAGHLAVFVPASAGAYPRSFLVEAALNFGATSDNSMYIFLQDGAGAPWRADIALDIGNGQYPPFALDSNGLADELPSTAQSGLQATGIGIADGFADYVSKPLFGTNAVAAPALTFAPGANTSEYVDHLKSLAGSSAATGGGISGSIEPQPDTWTYRLQSGGAAVFFTEMTNYTISGSFRLGAGIDTFVDPGNYSSVTEMAFNVLEAADPSRGGGAAIAVPYANTDYTGASAT